MRYQAIDATERGIRSDVDLVRRYDALLASEDVSGAVLVEVAGLYNELAYRVLSHRLLGWREGVDDFVVYAFCADPNRRRRLQLLLASARFDDDELEQSRQDVVVQMASPDVGAVDAGESEMSRLVDSADLLEEDLHEALDRLSLPRPVGSARQRILAVAAQTDSGVRAKLQDLWDRVSAGHVDAVEGLDRVVEERFTLARAQGLSHPLEGVRTRTGVDLDAVAAFLRENLKKATDARRVGRTTGETPSDLDLAEMPQGIGPTLSSADAISSFAARAQVELGLQIDDDRREGHRVLYATRAGEALGAMVLRSAEAGTAHTIALRNRTAWPGVDQLPVACSLVHFPADDRLGIVAIRTLFHELGHALQHLLWRRRVSNLAGLEFIPVERSELLSHMCEFWMYDPAVLGQVMAHADRPHLRAVLNAMLSRHRLAVLERTVVSWVDLVVHMAPGLGVGKAIEDLRSEDDLPRGIDEVRVATALASARHRARPGTAFAYSLGAARAAQAATEGIDILPEATDPHTPLLVPSPGAELILRDVGASEEMAG